MSTKKQQCCYASKQCPVHVSSHWLHGCVGVLYCGPTVSNTQFIDDDVSELCVDTLEHTYSCSLAIISVYVPSVICFT